MKFRIFISLLFSYILARSLAQDIHFSQFNYSPMNANPALAGMFVGDYRFVGNYKNQWSAQSLVPFNTLSVSADMKAYQLKKWNDMLGAGMVIYRDRAGDSKFTTYEIGVALSYIKSLGSDSSHYISIGARPTIVNRSFKLDDLHFDNQFNDGFFDPDIPIDESFDKTGVSFFDLNLGVAYRFVPKEKVSFETGFSISHINQPKASFYNDSDVKLNPKFNFQLRSEIFFTDRFSLIPELLYQRQDTKQESVFGASFRVKLNDNPGRTPAILPGFYYRTSDAAILFTGFEYGALFMGLSYDFNVSDLKPASNSRGGLEASLIYIITKVKKLKADGAVCPIF